MQKIIIRAKDSWLKFDFLELYSFRSVFFMLILRDIKLRYRQTFLGIAWVILQPLLTTLVFTFLFGKAIKLPTSEVPYVLFAFCGLIPWLVFSQSLQRASTSLIHDTRLITKVYFPRVFIPLSATFGVIIDFAIALGTFLILALYYQHPISSHIYLLLVCSLVLFTFSSGLNLFLSSLNVYYRDFKHIVPFLIQLWMYASPLFYPITLIPEKYRIYYCLNPMVGIIDGFRFALLGGSEFPWMSFSIAVTSSLVLLVSGMIIFRRIERYFADII